jgi:hypothetical protein
VNFCLPQLTRNPPCNPTGSSMKQIDRHRHYVHVTSPFLPQSHLHPIPVVPQQQVQVQQMQTQQMQRQRRQQQVQRQQQWQQVRNQDVGVASDVVQAQ